MNISRRRVVDGWDMGTALRQRRQDWRQPIVGIDCDGVLASDRLLWQRLRERFPEHIPARYDDLTSFEWPRATAESAALCVELSADPQFMARLAPIPGMAEALRRLRRQGYRLHVITARPECVRRATRRWLQRHGVSDCIEEIHCVEGGPAKVPVALALGCAAFVEDNHSTAEALGTAGIQSYLLDAPYNRMSAQMSLRVADWQALLADLAIAVPAGTRAAQPIQPERRPIVRSRPAGGLPAAALAS